jgi:hypothetical protein
VEGYKQNKSVGKFVERVPKVPECSAKVLKIVAGNNYLNFVTV